MSTAEIKSEHETVHARPATAFREAGPDIDTSRVTVLAGDTERSLRGSPIAAEYA